MSVQDRALSRKCLLETKKNQTKETQRRLFGL